MPADQPEAPSQPTVQSTSEPGANAEPAANAGPTAGVGRWFGRSIVAILVLSLVMLALSPRLYSVIVRNALIAVIQTEHSAECLVLEVHVAGYPDRTISTNWYDILWKKSNLQNFQWNGGWKFGAHYFSAHHATILVFDDQELHQYYWSAWENGVRKFSTRELSPEQLSAQGSRWFAGPDVQTEERFGLKFVVDSPAHGPPWDY